MQVILKEDVLNLGFKDDIVTVADGYGRNYLIPRGIAVIASESAIKVLNENLKQRKHKLEAIKKEAEAKAKKLEGVKLTVKAKTSKVGVIFGSVTAIQIAEELEKLGYDVDRKKIYLKGAIKEVGEYTYQIRFHRDVQIELPLTVESENVEHIESKEPIKVKENASEKREEPSTDEVAPANEELEKVEE